MFPECKNVTRQNCVTKWKTLPDGKQVWDGKENCEPMTWQECKLVPREVDFKVPKMNCNPAETITYKDCQKNLNAKMAENMICQVHHTTSCKPKVSEKCKSITYQECQELPKEECKPITIRVPFQE